MLRPGSYTANGELAADHLAIAAEQLDANIAGHALLHGGDKGVHRPARIREPEAVVHQVAVRGAEVTRNPIELARRHERLQVAVRRVEHDGGRRLMDLARLDAEQPILDHVDPADAVVAGNRRDGGKELDERHGHAVQRHRHTRLEGQLDVRGIARSVLDRARELEHVRGWLRPGILEHAAGDRAAPQVGVRPVRVLQRRCHRYAAGRGVGDRLRPCHVPLARGREDAQRGVERAHREIEPRLPVALPCGPVRDGGRPLHRGEIHERLRHQRTRERGGKRVLALVERAGLQGREHEAAREGVAHVEHMGADRPGRQRPLAHLVQLAALTEVERDGNDLGAERLGQPRDGHRRVEPARVGQNDAFHVCPFSPPGPPPGRVPLSSPCPAGADHDRCWRAISGG